MCGGQNRSMCRWLAYYGKPIRMDKVLYQGPDSLINQSLHSRLGAEPTNGDGFGIGWYSAAGDPGVFHSTEPAWNDRNLREISGHVESHLFLAHVRATTGTPVQQTNCHPFHHGRWLWMHNGLISDWLTVKRDLVLAVDPALYPLIEGTTDSEVLFYLALTLGLEEDPPAAVERAIGLVEEIGHRHGVKHPFQGTIATTNGERLWAFRYSSEGQSRSLYFSTLYDTLKALYPDDPRLDDYDEETRIVVSEPLGDVPGVWNQVPESSWGVVQPGPDELGTFRPAAPTAV
jgi:predicted glutamine amidotransferase